MWELTVSDTAWLLVKGAETALLDRAVVETDTATIEAHLTDYAMVGTVIPASRTTHSATKMWVII